MKKSKSLGLSWPLICLALACTLVLSSILARTYARSTQTLAQVAVTRPDEQVHISVIKDTIADALGLLPGMTSDAKAQQIGPGIFWVQRSGTDQKLASPAAEHWIVNTIERTAKLSKSQVMFDTSKISGSPVSDSLFMVQSDESLHGSRLVSAEYYNRKNGALIMSSEWKSGQAISLTRNGTTLDFSLKPIGGCSKIKSSGIAVPITALMVNDRELKLPRTHLVNCASTDGNFAYPELSQPLFDGDIITFSLPWNTEVDLSLKDFSPNGVTISE